MTDATTRDPITRQRSRWSRIDELAIDGTTAAVHERRVHDGILRALVSLEPGGWHLSISHTSAGKRLASRYPSWDEIADARYTLLPLDITVVMFLPPPEEYVALHATTFHLHELTAGGAS